MKPLIRAGVLLAVACVLRFGLNSNVGVHFTYWVVPLNVVGFWFFLLLAIVQLVRLLIGKPTFWTAHEKRRP